MTKGKREKSIRSLLENGNIREKQLGGEYGSGPGGEQKREIAVSGRFHVYYEKLGLFTTGRTSPETRADH
ncbi:hypothetical protein RUM43_002274 [Polyplax serrata]|uniref:Uncharacterized protein n=1 Tax=Polyplax serrata TaxID=468196 RepID=A0AAN8NYK8_POLSC